jgi:hypothetical protein
LKLQSQKALRRRLRHDLTNPADDMVYRLINR